MCAGLRGRPPLNPAAADRFDDGVAASEDESCIAHAENAGCALGGVGAPLYTAAED